MHSIGRPLKRLEDRPLLTGAGRFAADIAFPGQVTMRVVRSPSPSAASSTSMRARPSTAPA